MLYEVTLQGTYAGQNVLNRWNYTNSGTPAGVSGSFALLSALGFILPIGATVPTAGTMFDGIYRISVDTLQFTQVICRAIYDVADFYDNPFVPGVVGQLVQTGESPAVALGFRTSRVRQDIDRGTKRFAGVASVVIGQGGALQPGILALCATLATQMAAVATYNDSGNTISFTPTVVKKEKYTTPSGRQAYRYYSTLAAQSANWAQGFNWQVYPQVRTQRTRQYNVGQ